MTTATKQLKTARAIVNIVLADELNKRLRDRKVIAHLNRMLGDLDWLLARIGKDEDDGTDDIAGLA